MWIPVDIFWKCIHTTFNCMKLEALDHRHLAIINDRHRPVAYEEHTPNQAPTIRLRTDYPKKHNYRVVFGCVFTCNARDASGEPLFATNSTCAVHV